MKSFREHIKSLEEASFLRAKYPIGHEIRYNGKDFKILDDLGYKEGDIFTIVKKPKNDKNVFMVIGKENAANQKYLQGPDKRIFLFRGAEGYKGSSFTHAKDSPEAHHWESLIVFAYNKLNNVKSDAKVIDIAKRFQKMYLPIAEEFAKQLKSQIKKKQLVQTGGGLKGVTLGKYWIEAGAGDKTPKTDLADSNFQYKISLKAADSGSQLMSPYPEESVAVVSAALAEMGKDAAFAGDLTDQMADKMGRLLTSETTTNVKARAASGEDDANIQRWRELEDNHQILNDMISETLNDPKYGDLLKRNIVLEAATGNNKFGNESSPAAANLIVKFSINEQKIIIDEIKSIDDKIVKIYAKVISPKISFKKAGATSIAASSLRMIIPALKTLRKKGLDSNDTNEEILTFKGIIKEEIENISELNGYLNEDLLYEDWKSYLNKAVSSAKELGKNIVNKVKGAIDTIMKKVIDTLKYFAKLGKEMFEKLLEWLGVKISNVNGLNGIFIPEEKLAQ